MDTIHSVAQRARVMWLLFSFFFLFPYCLWALVPVHDRQAVARNFKKSKRKLIFLCLEFVHFTSFDEVKFVSITFVLASIPIYAMRLTLFLLTLIFTLVPCASFNFRCLWLWMRLNASYFSRFFFLARCVISYTYMYERIWDGQQRWVRCTSHGVHKHMSRKRV